MNPNLKAALMFVGYIGLDIAAVLWYVSIPVLPEIGLLALVFAAIVWTGMKHGWIYSQPGGQHYDRDIGWIHRGQDFVYHKLEIHNTQWIGEYVIFAIAMLGGASPLRVLGAQFLARLIFQGYINWGSGKPFIDLNEHGEWGHGKKVTKFLPGRWSLMKPVIGVACIAASFLVRYVCG